MLYMLLATWWNKKRYCSFIGPMKNENARWILFTSGIIHYFPANHQAFRHFPRTFCSVLRFPKPPRKTIPRLGAGDHDTLQQNVEHLEARGDGGRWSQGFCQRKKKTNQLDSPVGVVFLLQPTSTDHLSGKNNLFLVGDFKNPKKKKTVGERIPWITPDCEKLGILDGKVVVEIIPKYNWVALNFNPHPPKKN